MALLIKKQKKCRDWLPACFCDAMIQIAIGIKYHLGKSHELGVTTDQMYEIFAVANIVGGTILIPHTRRVAEYWEELITG